MSQLQEEDWKVFNKLKVNKKRKPKRSLLEEEDEEEFARRRERIQIIREAQKVKEKNNWQNWLDTEKKRVGPRNGTSEDDQTLSNTVEGLRQNFAQEKSDQVQDPQMLEFIEKQVSKKYATDNNHSTSTDTRKYSTLTDWESIRQIPYQLGLSKKEPHQPCVNFSTSGVEEVTLPESYRHKNLVETEKAKQRLSLRQSNMPSLEPTMEALWKEYGEALVDTEENSEAISQYTSQLSYIDKEPHVIEEKTKKKKPVQGTFKCDD
eukprot:jgi/Galph1/4389/GphlegSOOS_G3122.1